MSGPSGDSVEYGLQIGWEEWAENNGQAWQCEKPLSFCAGEIRVDVILITSSIQFAVFITKSFVTRKHCLTKPDIPFPEGFSTAMRRKVRRLGNLVSHSNLLTEEHS